MGSSLLLPALQHDHHVRTILLGGERRRAVRVRLVEGDGELAPVRRGWRVGTREPGITDRDGRYSVAGRKDHGVLVVVTHAGRQLSSAGVDYRQEARPRPKPEERTVFFADRSLYRPGQTIRFKGVCIHFFQEKDRYETIPNRDVTVVLSDVNQNEIARHRVRTNDYGSFRHSTPGGPDGRSRLRGGVEPPAVPRVGTGTRDRVTKRAIQAGRVSEVSAVGRRRGIYSGRSHRQFAHLPGERSFFRQEARLRDGR